MSFQVIQEHKELHTKTEGNEVSTGAEEVTPGWLVILSFEDVLLTAEVMWS
jgi:hypothetical protein